MAAAGSFRRFLKSQEKASLPPPPKHLSLCTQDIPQEKDLDEVLRNYVFLPWDVCKSFLTNRSRSLLAFKLSSDRDATVTLSFTVPAGRNILVAASLNPPYFILSPLHLICSGHREHIIASFAPNSHVFLNFIIVLPIIVLLLLFHLLFSRLSKCNYFRLSSEAILIDLQSVSLSTAGLAPSNLHLS